MEVKTQMVKVKRHKRTVVRRTKRAKRIPGKSTKRVTVRKHRRRK